MLRIRPLRAAGALLAAILLAACGGAEDRLAEHLERGQQFVAEQNLEKARVEFRNALQIDPKNVAAMYELARVAERQQNLREAVGFLRGAIETDPAHLPSRAALGRIYLFAGLIDEAYATIEPGLADHPSDPDLLTVRSAVRSRKGDPLGAIEDAEAAVKGAPDNENALALLASLWAQNARTDKAIEILEDGVKRLPQSVDLHTILADLLYKMDRVADAERTLLETIRLRPTDPGVRTRMARFYVAAGQVDKAEKVLRDAVALEPEATGPKITLAEFLSAQRSPQAGIEALEASLRTRPDDVELRLAAGRFLEQRGSRARAEALYREVIVAEQDGPKGLDARNRIAALLVDQNRLDAARAIVDEVLAVNARDNDALVIRGNIALANGDTASAVADLRSVLRDQPESVPVLRALARAHLQEGNVALAEESLRSAVQANAADRPARLDFAQVLVQQGRFEQALPILEQLIKDSPDDVEARHQLFRVHATQGNWQLAREQADEVRRRRPDLALGHYLLAGAALGLERPQVAEEELLKALTVQPDSVEPLSELVRFYVAAGRFGDALARLDGVIAQFPDNAIARNLKGETLIKQKRFADAVLALGQAVKLAPGWWVPHRNLALAQVGAGRTDDAIRTFEAGFQASKGPLLMMELATLQERLGRPQDSIASYERLLAAVPESEVAANNLAMLLVTYGKDAGDLARAKDLAERFAASRNPTYLNTYGWVLYQHGEVEQALPALQKAVEGRPESSLLRYHLALAQFKAGRRDEARSNLERALARDDAFPGRQDAQQLLAELRSS
jgi:tetratricopeptide (TPR) repeat protein